VPFQLYGNWLVQTVARVVSLSTLFIVNIRLMIESQPLRLVRVSLYVPAVLNCVPFQVYGNWLVQTVALVVSLSTLFIVRIKLIIESHPLLLVRVSLYVPAVLILVPFQVYGNWLVQMVALVVSLSTLFTVRMRLMIESQPLRLVRVSLYVPAVLNCVPFQVYGNWLVQTVALVVSLSTLFIVRMRLIIESQPLRLVRVSL